MTPQSMLWAATIGCGRMGAFQSRLMSDHAPPFWLPVSHLPALSLLDGVKAVACSDVSADNRARAMADFNVPRGYESGQALLAAEADLDIVTIATRTPEKPALLRAALAAGIPALHLEKPLCNSMAELVQMRALLSQTQSHVTFGALRRYLDPYKMIRARSQSPDFGPLTDIHIEMGSAPLMWTLVHGLDLLLYFVGAARPQAVQAWFEGVETDPDQPHTIISDPRFVSATVLFDNGVTGRVGRTSGAAVTLSSATARLECFADGQQIFASRLGASGVYQEREALPAPPSHGAPGGTLAPLRLLRDSLRGDAAAQAEAHAAKVAITGTQDLIFDMLHSHLQGGQVVPPGQAPEDLCILGITHGNPA